jgi:hypothetical protein
MPGGGSLLGLGYFVGIKLVGYSLAGTYLNRQYSVESPRPLIFGLARTTLGLVFGVAYAGLAAGLALERGELI